MENRVKILIAMEMRSFAITSNAVWNRFPAMRSSVRQPTGSARQSLCA